MGDELIDVVGKDFLLFHTHNLFEEALTNRDLLELPAPPPLNLRRSRKFTGSDQIAFLTEYLAAERS